MAAFKKVVSSGGDCDEDETLRNRFRRGSAVVSRRASMSSRSSSSGGKKFLAPPFFADGFNAYRQKFRNSAKRSSVAFNFDVSSQDPSTLKIPADHDLALCIDGEKDPVTADDKVIDSSLALEARPSLADEQQQFSAPQNLDLEAIVALYGASADKKQVEEKDAGDDEAMHFDDDYIRALEHGLPPTAGEGIGIDRLVMLFSDSPTIKDVILFPHMRPEVD